jgi:VWFA-related protein
MVSLRHSVHTRHPFRLLIGLAALLALALAPALPAQQSSGSDPAPAGGGSQEPGVPADPASQEQVPVFRGGVDSVMVDVIVTDNTGNPVTDLTAADFEVREAGDLQTVETFRLVETQGPIDAPPARDILSFDDHRRETSREENRLFVLFLDDYHVRRGNDMVVREQLAEFLTGLSDRDLVAVANPLSVMAGLTFSRNHLATASIVREFRGRKFDYTPLNAIEARYQTLGPEAQEQFRNDMVISSLRNLSEMLGGMREGRKTILYVSEGLVGALPSGVRVTGGLYGPETIQRGNSSRQQSQDFFEQTSLIQNMDRIFSAASRNNVSIYTLDPRGLSNFEYGVNEDVSSADDRRILQESTDILRVVAEQTDGRAIVARNDPLPALRQMVRDNSTYYLLGYVSTRAPRDGKFHEIEVRVRRPGVQIRARKGYWAYSPEDIARATTPARPAAPAAVVEALDELGTRVGARRGRSVSTWMGAQRGPAEKAVVTFAWEPTAPGPGGDPLEAVAQVTITAQSVTGEQLYSGTVAREGTAARNGGLVTFEAPPGTVSVRVSAENASGRRIDSDETGIEVPDFTQTGPQISTPFVFTGRTARDLQQIRAAALPVPAVRRSFSRTERLLIRFGAYGPAGTTPRLTMRLLNNQGESIAELPPPVAAGDRFEAEVGLSSFPPGEYLVEIAAAVGEETTTELVAIRVTG